MRWLELRLPPPIVALAAAALMWLLARLTPSLDFPFTGHVSLGLAIGVTGILVNIAGVVEFRRARTTVNPFKPDTASALVRVSIFKHTRNPMYLGLAIVLVGFGVFLGNPLSLVMVLGFVAYMNRFQVAPEERALRTLFGPEYAAYQQAVRRWL